MPDITLPNTFVNNSVAAAAEATENLYTPRSTPDNFEVINGRLTRANFEELGVKVEREMVRSKQFSVGSTSGATANQDFFHDLYQGAWDIATPSEAADRAIAIPGACKTFHNPYNTASMVYISWHVGILVDHDVELTGATVATFLPTGDTRLLLFINGVAVSQISRQIMHSRRTCARSVGPPGANYVDALLPDQRFWSGHFCVDAANVAALGLNVLGINPLVKGHHTAEIRLALGEQGLQSTGAGSVPPTRALHARIKTRRMTALVIR